MREVAAVHVCPQCGAAAGRDEADAFATCRFCGTRLFLGAEPGVRHEMLLPAIRAGDVPARLATWLEEREAAGTPAEIASRLVFLPFWAHAGRGGDPPVPAAPLLADGIEAFRLPAGDAKGFDPAAAPGAEFLPATVARDALPFASAPAAEIRLVHVPFYEISMKIFGRPVRVLLDAVAGQAFARDPIPTSERRLDRAYAVLLTILFGVAFAGFWSLFRGAHARGSLFLLVAGPGLVLVTRQILVALEEA